MMLSQPIILYFEFSTRIQIAPQGKDVDLACYTHCPYLRWSWLSFFLCTSATGHYPIFQYLQ